MNNTITLHKQDGANYRTPIKAYDLERNGVTVGTLQTWGTVWEVLDAPLTASPSTPPSKQRYVSRRGLCNEPFYYPLRSATPYRRPL